MSDIQKLLHISYDDILAVLNSDFLESVKFVGLDIKKIHAKIEAVEDENKQENIEQLINIFLRKGTNLSKIKQRSKYESRNFITNMERKYSLSSKANNPEALTLSRIAAAYPRIVVTILESDDDVAEERPAKGSEMDARINGRFPRFLMSSASAAVIPLKEQFDNEDSLQLILPAVTLYGAFESVRIDPSLEGNVMSGYNKSTTYVDLAHESQIMSPEQRRDFCIEHLPQYFSEGENDKVSCTGEFTTVLTKIKEFVATLKK